MSDNSGASGLLGVNIGVVLVFGLAFFFRDERVGLRSPSAPTLKSKRRP